MNVACDLWHLVAKIFLRYFSQHTDDIDLLFLMLRALCLRFIPDFQVSFTIRYLCFIFRLMYLLFFFSSNQFLRDFLANTVAQNYTVEWKRKVFFHFVENFAKPNLTQELKAKVNADEKIICEIKINHFFIQF